MTTTYVRLESKASLSWVLIWVRTNFSQFLVRDRDDETPTYVLFILTDEVSDKRRKLPRADLNGCFRVRSLFLRLGVYLLLSLFFCSRSDFWKASGLLESYTICCPLLSVVFICNGEWQGGLVCCWILEEDMGDSQLFVEKNMRQVV